LNAKWGKHYWECPSPDNEVEFFYLLQKLGKTLIIDLMTLFHMLTQTTLKASRQWLGRLGLVNEHKQGGENVLIPICALNVSHLTGIKKHLLALSAQDRYLRFGYAANDEQIKRYVDGLNFQRDEIYGIFNRNLDIVAMAHLAIIKEPDRTSKAEFGVSVKATARGRGYGAHLFERAVMHARNEKISEILIHALSENAPMIHIARKSGAILERDGSETEAYLRLPKRDLDSRVTELLVDQFAKANYSVKEDAKRFWDFLAKVDEIRQGVRAGRHQSAE
jgi:RimJ/RimL family protein N-acetyltransferase